jgi:hypothetical protein
MSCRTGPLRSATRKRRPVCGDPVARPLRGGYIGIAWGDHLWASRWSAMIPTIECSK